MDPILAAVQLGQQQLCRRVETALVGFQHFDGAGEVALGREHPGDLAPRVGGKIAGAGGALEVRPRVGVAVLFLKQPRQLQRD